MPSTTRHATLRPALIVAAVAATLTGCASAPSQQMRVEPLTRTQSSYSATERHYAFGRYYLGEARYKAAIAEFDRLLELVPDHVEAMNGRATALVALGEHDEALRMMRQAIKLRPNAAHLYNNIGYIYMQKGRTDTARASFEQALALEPGMARAKDNLAALGPKDDAASVAAAETAPVFVNGTGLVRLEYPSTDSPSKPRITVPAPSTAAAAPAITVPTVIPSAAETAVSVAPAPSGALAPATSDAAVTRPAPVAPTAVAPVNTPATPTAPAATTPAPAVAKPETPATRSLAQPTVVMAGSIAEPGTASLEHRSVIDLTRMEPRTVDTTPVATITITPRTEMQARVEAAVGQVIGATQVAVMPSLTPATDLTARYARIDISNGNGITGLARAFGRQLREQGTTVANLSNVKGYAVVTSTVYYRNGHEEIARSLLATLPKGARLEAVDSLPFGRDVRVVLGRDLTGNVRTVGHTTTGRRILRIDTFAQAGIPTTGA